MSTIVLRNVKGAPLTNTEVDTNFSNLNTDKVEKTAAAITGGTINGTSVGASTASTGAFTSLTATSGVVSANSSTDAFRITQTGTGNALVVEDAANPDATPFVIETNGRVVFGNTVAINFPDTQGTQRTIATEVLGNTYTTSSSGIASFINSTNSGGALTLAQSRNTTVGSHTIVNSNDAVGAIQFAGSDGTAFIRAARIEAAVDGTPGTNDMPGRLLLSTTPDGSDTPVERVRITSAGKTGFATAAPAATVHVAGDTILSNVNVLGASYDNVSFSVAGEELTPTDLFFSSDGLKMYIIGTTGDDVNEYNLSTAWVVSSAVFVTNFSVSSQDATPNGLFFRADGTKMYVIGTTNDAVFQYTLSTPWSVATASYDNVSFSVAGQEISPGAIWFKPNGLSMYVAGSTGDAVYQYTLSTAWNVSTATFLQSFSVSGQESTPLGMCFTGDGSRMFITGNTGDDVNVYNLTTPWNISTAAFVNVFSVAGQDVSPQGMYIKPDGTKMYIVGSANDAVFQYTVPSIDIQLTGPTSVASLEVQQDLVVYGNTTGSFLNNGFRENIGGQYYNLVSQADIGTAPNEIPLNQYLGNLAYQDAANIAGDVGVGGALIVVGATTLAAASMASATVTGAVEASGGVVAEQLLIDYFTASSSAVLRGGATNLLTFSEEFNDAAWTKGNSTITANTVVAPDGTLTGDTFADDTANATHTLFTAVITSAPTTSAVTATIYVKQNNQSNLFILYITGNSIGATFGRVASTFDLSTGTVAGNNVVNGATFTGNSITPVGNGWYRCSVTGTVGSTASPTGVRFVAGFATVPTSTLASTYIGSGQSVFIWGAQLEAASTAGAYLKTVASAVSTAYAAPLESPNGLAIPLLATMTPARNADMTFQLTSDTSLEVKVKGSDGTVRSVILTLA